MHQVITAPRNARQMLMAFAMYNPEKPLHGLISRMDLEGFTRRQVYHTVLGRAPGRGSLAVDGPDFNPIAAIISALQGEEFQARIREIALTAFADKRRMIFIHVPKCAGSDMLETLRRRYPYMHNHHALPDITSKPLLFDMLRRLALGTNHSDAIAVAGHVPLRWYTDRALVRFDDEVFTSVRHPRDILYSVVSFILTRIVEFPDVNRPDIRTWLSEVGMTELEPNPSKAYLAELGSKLLRARGRNIICTHLGNGTADSALDALVMTDTEITDTTRFSAWRRDKFGFDPPRRINASLPLFTAETATPADRALIEEMITEDMVLYEKISARLSAQDGLSIRGRVFA